MPRVTPRLKPLSKTFLRQWRDYRGLSQEAAADRIQIDRSLLSKIENGKAAYNQAFLESAASAYRCTPADLLMRDPTDKSAIWSIVDALEHATPSERIRILAVVETLLKSTG